MLAIQRKYISFSCRGCILTNKLSQKWNRGADSCKVWRILSVPSAWQKRFAFIWLLKLFKCQFKCTAEKHWKLLLNWLLIYLLIKSCHKKLSFLEANCVFLKEFFRLNNFLATHFSVSGVELVYQKTEGVLRRCSKRYNK